MPSIHEGVALTLVTAAMNMQMQIMQQQETALGTADIRQCDSLSSASFVQRAMTQLPSSTLQVQPEHMSPNLVVSC